MRPISAEALRQYMQFRGYTIRSLADKISTRQMPVSHSTIGHLLTGYRKSCQPEVARAIAKALDCPVESLFTVKVSIVSREVHRKAAA